MKKEDFITAVKIQNQIIADAKEAIQLYSSEYIAAANHFNPGDKITISTSQGKRYNLRTSKEEITPAGERFAFVASFILNHFGDFSYRLRKCKKDGTMSEIADYLGRYDTINPQQAAL